MLCTSGSEDDVMFSHNGPMARHVYCDRTVRTRLAYSIYGCVVVDYFTVKQRVFLA